MKKPVLLMILDGYGLADSSKANAISLANTPNMDSYFSKYPNIKLKASGLAVGLPEGQMGNSEVGHLNLGAGRTVYQSLTRINVEIDKGTFFTNEVLLEAIDHAKANDSKLHLYGLMSDGGVHSHIDHFKGMLKMAKDNGLTKVYVHAFLDGRDTPPTSGAGFLKELSDYMSEINFGKIASVHGRYYAMDRDKNYDRVKTSYDVMIGEVVDKTNKDLFEVMEKSYENNVTDEFVIPVLLDSEGIIEDNDSVICMNFRPDRAIEISTMVTNMDHEVVSVKSRKLNNIFYVSMMHYSETVISPVAYGLQSLENGLAEVLSKNNKRQLRIAETEKYAHVTFFFDGGEDKVIPLADRALVPSPKVATYDLMPEMSAYLVTERLLEELAKEVYDVIILNYANCDMVGHTGSIPAAIKAVEVVDECVGKIVEKVNSLGGVVMITADHGNADKMLDENDNEFTAHTTNPVPFIITSNEYQLTDNTDVTLGDISPTILEVLNITQPVEMTGKSLIKK